MYLFYLYFNLYCLVNIQQHCHILEIVTDDKAMEVPCLIARIATYLLPGWCKYATALPLANVNADSMRHKMM